MAKGRSPSSNKPEPKRGIRRARISVGEQRARRLLMWGAALLLLGLAMAGTGRADIASVIALPGLVLTIFGIHTFGRLGPEEEQRGAQ